eukprot:9711205-Heterocapsa_arctica.AAC.1
MSLDHWRQYHEREAQGVVIAPYYTKPYVIAPYYTKPFRLRFLVIHWTESNGDGESSPRWPCTP